MNAPVVKRRSLILAGGGMRVAYQAGALQALSEAGLTFEHADGTSGGTMNLAMLLSGQSPMEMCARWRGLNPHDFVSLLPLQEYLTGPDVRALGDADGIVTKVFPQLGIDIAKINACRTLTGTFNVCNFSKKINEVIPNDCVTLSHLVAGISLPLVMPAVVIEGEAFTDSVWIQDANLLEAVRRGAEEIWLVWCIGNTPEFHDGAFQQYVHMIEISANSALFEELAQIAEINAAIERGDSRYGQRTPIIVHVIKPAYPLPLDPDYYVGRIDSATLLALGYSDAREYCASLATHAGGTPLTTEATRMKSGRPGIAFRETLEGSLTMAAEGELRVAMSICIQDLERFMRGPEHQGQIHATVDWLPIGRGLE
ncbi:MAG: hypothetical protein RL701_6886 [Pseudomonadota bacterium]